MITCAPPGGGQTDRFPAEISDRNFRTEISGQTFGPKIPPEISAGIFPNCLSTGGSLKNDQKWHERVLKGTLKGALKGALEGALTGAPKGALKGAHTGAPKGAFFHSPSTPIGDSL